MPYGEPFMSKYNLGSKISGSKIKPNQLYMKSLLHMGDGETDFIKVSNQLNISANELNDE